ncbi:MAG: lipid A deacylase LpxR family protein [Thermodesulfobacteriota bacterium]
MFFFVFLLIFVLCHPATIRAEETAKDPSRKSFGLYVENDFFFGDDREFTSGLKLTWSRAGMKRFPKDARSHRWLYPVVHFLGFEGEPDSDKILGINLSVGQNIYTPENIESKELIENERPYAGISYVELGYHQRYGNYMDTIGFYGGIVGPHSYGEQFQSAFHELVNGIDPKGWDNQLENEPIIGVVYEIKKRVITPSSFTGIGYDMILNTGGGIGNAQTYYNIGAMARWGWHLPNDFGTFPMRPASYFNPVLDVQPTRHETADRFGLHLFLSANTRAVIRNIFLDGNTFQDSHSVSKKPVVSSFMGGVGIISGRFKTSLSYVYQTESFKQQKDPQAFGSFNISYAY